MKKNNIPLNFREKNNSRISLLCSAAVLIVLVFLMHQLDYGLITKPEEKAAQEAQKKEEEAKKSSGNPGDHHCKCNRSGRQSLSQ